jgi:hypothetical protein
MKKEFCRNFYECEMKRISVIIRIRRKSEITLCLVENNDDDDAKENSQQNKTRM